MIERCRKKPDTNGEKVSCRLDERLATNLDSFCLKEGITRSIALRCALSTFLEIAQRGNTCEGLIDLSGGKCGRDFISDFLRNYDKNFVKLIIIPAGIVSGVRAEGRHRGGTSPPWAEPPSNQISDPTPRDADLVIHKSGGL